MSDFYSIENSVDEDLLETFYNEAERGVDSAESNLLALEKNPSDAELVKEILRFFHTLKSNSAAVKMRELSDFVHVAEDLLVAIRDNKRAVDGDVIQALFAAVDVVRAELGVGAEICDEDIDGVRQRLSKLALVEAAEKSADVLAENAAGKTSVDADSDGELLELLQEYYGENSNIYSTIWRADVFFDKNVPMKTVGRVEVFKAFKKCGDVPLTVPNFEAILGDECFAKVVYYVASNMAEDEIKAAAFRSEATLSVKLTKVLPRENACEKAENHDCGKNAKKPENPLHEVGDIMELPCDLKSDAAETPQNAVQLSSDAVVEKFFAGNAAEKTDGDRPAAEEPRKKHENKILNVESRRVDNLMNMVSEAVIVKSALNKISQEYSELYAKIMAEIAKFSEKTAEFGGFFSKSGTNVQYQDEHSAQILDCCKNFEKDLRECTKSFKVINSRSKLQAQIFSRIAGEMQEGVMRMRMVPIDGMFKRVERTVHDLAHKLGKKIRVEIEGEATELDKSVVDMLHDPLGHCVRNSADHGIEMPDERVKAGKDEVGCISMKARNEGNIIVVEIGDDGRGIDYGKIRKKAVEDGIVEDGSQLNDEMCRQMLFRPGFSTANKITDVSGRGIGLDVLKTQVEKLRGTISLESEPGIGTAFVIRLPLTLAILQVLLVKIGTEIYAIPISSVVESLRVKEDEIFMLDGNELLQIRDEVVSVFRLNLFFGVESVEKPRYRYVVVVSVEEQKLCLMVDALLGEEDIVIKPLNEDLMSSFAVSGASILGDGSVTLIIDPAKLFEVLQISAKSLFAARNRTLPQSSESDVKQ